MGVVIEGIDKAAATLPPGQGRAESSLRRLSVGGQPFFVLKQRGTFPDIAHDHARLLAPEVEKGAFPEIIATIARGVNLESETLTKVAGALYRCYSDRVLKNCSREFRDAVAAFAVGYRSGVGQPKFSDLQVADAFAGTDYSFRTDVELTGSLEQFSDPDLAAALGGLPLARTPEELTVMGADDPATATLALSVSLPGDVTET